MQRKLDEAKRKTNINTKIEANYVNYKEEESDEGEIIGPLPPPQDSNINTSASKEQGKRHDYDRHDDSDYSDDDDTDDSPLSKIPFSHEVNLTHGNKAVAALALDPSGSRLASSGYDFDLKFWDFNSMDVHLNAFRTLQPVESHWVYTLQYSVTGDILLIAAGNAQPQVIDRNGHQIYECKKGDQYLVDMKNTKGHVSMVRAACWDPKNRDNFASCGNDGTIRIWDINTVKKNKHVIVLKNKQNKKTGCTYCCFNKDGKTIFGSGEDGSIQAWDTRKMFVNTSLKNMQAHGNGSETSCLLMSYDDRTLISRGGDDTLKLWDIRNFKLPVKTANNLVTYYTSTKCVFSPDEKLILTGTSVKKGQGAGKLVFLDRENLDVVSDVPFDDISVVSTLWHPKLNQIFVGLSDGNIKVLFDPEKSRNGVTLCVGRVKNKRVDIGESMLKPQIINPHALKMYREKRADTMKKVKAKLRADPVASHKPEAPLETGHGVGGRLKEGMSLTGFVVKNIALAKKDDSNPREAILKHAAEAEKNPFWISPAYANTQPKTLFKEGPDTDEEDEDEGDGILAKKAKTE